MSLKIVTRTIILILPLILYLYLDNKSSVITPSAIQTNLGIHDDYTIPNDSHPIDLQYPETTFSLKINPSQNVSQLTFYYQCHPSCPEMWLSLPNNAATPSTQILLHHPIFTQFPLPYISNGTYNLYQKKIAYSSVKQFLSLSPQTTIYTESPLFDLFHPSTQLVDILHLLPQETPNFILTTYHKPRIFGDWLEFSRFHQIPQNSLKAGTLTATISSQLSSKNPPTVKIIPKDPISPFSSSGRISAYN